MDNADAGAAVRGYSAAEAAHMFEQFLEHRLSRQAFDAWLNHYPYEQGNRPAPGVEDEINLAVLALRNLDEGRRTGSEVRRELLDARRRLSGLAYNSRP